MKEPCRIKEQRTILTPSHAQVAVRRQANSAQSDAPGMGIPMRLTPGKTAPRVRRHPAAEVSAATSDSFWQASLVTGGHKARIFAVFPNAIHIEDLIVNHQPHTGGQHPRREQAFGQVLESV